MSISTAPSSHSTSTLSQRPRQARRFALQSTPTIIHSAVLASFSTILKLHPASRAKSLLCSYDFLHLSPRARLLSSVVPSQYYPSLMASWHVRVYARAKRTLSLLRALRLQLCSSLKGSSTRILRHYSRHMHRSTFSKHQTYVSLSSIPYCNCNTSGMSHGTIMLQRPQGHANEPQELASHVPGGSDCRRGGNSDPPPAHSDDVGHATRTTWSRILRNGGKKAFEVPGSMAPRNSDSEPLRDGKKSV